MGFTEILEQAIQHNIEEVEKYKLKKEIEMKYSRICSMFTLFICKHTSEIYEFKRAFPSITFCIPSTFYDPLICTVDPKKEKGRGLLYRSLSGETINFTLSNKGKVIKELHSISIQSSKVELEQAFMYVLKSFLIEVMELTNCSPYSTFANMITAGIQLNSEEINLSVNETIVIERKKQIMALWTAYLEKQEQDLAILRKVYPHLSFRMPSFTPAGALSMNLLNPLTFNQEEIGYLAVNLEDTNINIVFSYRGSKMKAFKENLAIIDLWSSESLLIQVFEATLKTFIQKMIKL